MKRTIKKHEMRLSKSLISMKPASKLKIKFRRRKSQNSLNKNLSMTGKSSNFRKTRRVTPTSR